MKTEIKNISKEELEKVPYQNLLKKFTELGIKSVWKAGTKKVVLIKAALDKIESINKIISENKDIKEEDIEKKLELEEVKDKDLKEEELVTTAKDKADKEKKIIEEETNELNNYSSKQLHEMLLNLNHNLNHGLEVHRDILLKKHSILKDFIENKIDKK